MSPRLPGAAVAAVLAAGALVACASSGSPASGSEDSSGTLRQVLDHVSATSSTRQMLLYSRPKAAVAANGGEATAPAYSRTVGWADPLAVSSVQVKRALGFDPSTAEVALTVGNPPLSPTWLSGLATAPDPKLLAQLGAKKSGSTYRFAADNAISLTSPLGRAVPSAGIGLNVLQVDGTSVRFGASSAALAMLAPQAANLGDDKAEVAVAECLGNPLAAMITNAVQSSAVSGFTAVGVGVTGGAGDPPTDQMCVATKSAADAQHIAEAVRRTLGRGSSHSGQRWSSLLKNAKASVDDTMMKLTATPIDGPGGVLLLAVQQQDLPGFSG